MALRFIDSFDHYASGDLTEKWTTLAGTISISSGTGRRGTASLRHGNASAGGNQLSRTFDSQATWIVGVAVRAASPAATTTRGFLELRDGSTLHVDVRFNADSTLAVTRNGTILGSSTTALQADLYYYIELYATIHDTAGVVILRINGVTEVNLSGVDTRNAATASANQVRLGPVAAWTGTVDYDDLYICDGQGSVNNDFLGDCRCDALFPNGDGDTVQFSRSGGASNFANVNETPPNDDTDYNESNTVGHRDLLHFQNLTPLTDPAIFGVQVLANARKVDSGARGIGLPVKSGSTVSAGPDQALSTSYAYYRRLLETDPDTAAAWSEAGVNALQAGVEVMS